MQEYRKISVCVGDGEPHKFFFSATGQYSFEIENKVEEAERVRELEGEQVILAPRWVTKRRETARTLRTSWSMKPFSAKQHHPTDKTPGTGSRGDHGLLRTQGGRAWWGFSRR
jgi:hypothetical protein